MVTCYHHHNNLMTSPFNQYLIFFIIARAPHTYVCACACMCLSMRGAFRLLTFHSTRACSHIVCGSAYPLSLLRISSCDCQRTSHYYLLLLLLNCDSVPRPCRAHCVQHLFVASLTIQPSPHHTIYRAYHHSTYLCHHHYHH